MSLRKQSYFYRWVALLFVLLVLAEILFSPPNSKQFELLGIPLVNVAAHDAHQRQKETQCVLASGCQNGEPQQSELPDDDCISWCPHVLASSPFSVAMQSMTALTANQNVLRLLSAPPQSMFHPPRVV